VLHDSNLKIIRSVFTIFEDIFLNNLSYLILNMGDQYTTDISSQTNLVSIFWDIENCAVPKNKSAASLVCHIRREFVTNRLNHRECVFMAACDATRLRKGIVEDLTRIGM